MHFYFAPMEGLTGYVYRNAHHAFFDHIDKYFSPFIAANQSESFKTRELQDILPENNQGIVLIPQLLTNHEMKVIDQICDRVAVIDNSRIAETGYVSDVFTNPQSQIARELILPKANTTESIVGERRLRIIFDGEASSKPVIANLVLECQVPVNIMFADTRDIEGRAYGQMILQLPDDTRQQERVLSYLKAQKITFSQEV